MLGTLESIFPPQVNNGLTIGESNCPRKNDSPPARHTYLLRLVYICLWVFYRCLYLTRPVSPPNRHCSALATSSVLFPYNDQIPSPSLRFKGESLGGMHVRNVPSLLALWLFFRVWVWNLLAVFILRLSSLRSPTV